MFPKVKNVNVESPKKRSKLLFFFGALFPLSSPSMLMNDFVKAAFILLGARIVFVGEARIDFVGGHELILFVTRIVFVGEARIDFVWNSNCSRFVQN